MLGRFSGCSWGRSGPGRWALSRLIEDLPRHLRRGCPRTLGKLQRLCPTCQGSVGGTDVVPLPHPVGD